MPTRIPKIRLHCRLSPGRRKNGEREPVSVFPSSWEGAATRRLQTHWQQLQAKVCLFSVCRCSVLSDYKTLFVW